MRECMLFILLFCCSANFIAQIIENPAFENSDVPTFHIKKVEITKDTTYIFCLYYAEARYIIIPFVVSILPVKIYFSLIFFNISNALASIGVSGLSSASFFRTGIALSVWSFLI